MPHMVIFRNNEGKPGYHQADALDEAVRFVEHLRNQEQVSDARIFTMQEVPIEFRTYYKVEIGGVPVPDEVPVPAAETGASGEGVSAEPPGEAMPEPVPVGNGSPSAHARFGRFNRP